MPRGTVIIDGLWRCLCPSYSPASLNRAGLALTSRKRASKPDTVFASASSQRCCYSSSSSNPAETGADRQIRSKKNHDDKHAEPSSSSRHQPVIASHDPNNEDAQENANTAQKNKKKNIKRPPRKPLGVPKDLERRTTENLETMLQDLMAKSPSILSATQILRTLIRDRHVRPDLRHYRALILANTDADRGSPEIVRRLLSEMEENRIPTDSGTLHAALQVLAVHPDYLLRQQIVNTLRDRWLPLSPAGWHFVVAGLIREHQFELALGHITAMETKGIHIENWLHSLLVYNLCEFEEFDEVLNLMRSRDSQNYDITYDLWMYVLDVASEAMHHETTAYVWKHRVGLGYLYPSYGVCSNALTVASRTGDTELAASVFRFLTDTGVPLNLEDYERMVETHVMSGDLFTAFDVLCNMHKAGIELEESSTRSVLTYMILNKTNPGDAWAMLKKLKAMKYEIPTRCAKSVIQLCEHTALYESSVVDTGIAFYKELHTLCPEGADVLIYNSLINMCRRGRNHKAAMFAVKEMASLGIVPDATTFEHMVGTCLEARNYRSAYMYFQDMMERGHEVSEEAQTQIRELCSAVDDVYAMKLRTHRKIRADFVINRDGIKGEESEPESPGKQSEPVIIKVPFTPSPEQIAEDETRAMVLGRTGLKYQRQMERERSQQGEQFQSEQSQQRHRFWPRDNFLPREQWKALQRARSKESRKRKRRRLAIQKAMEEDDWMNWEAGGLVPDPPVGESEEDLSVKQQGGNKKGSESDTP